MKENALEAKTGYQAKTITNAQLWACDDQITHLCQDGDVWKDTGA